MRWHSPPDWTENDTSSGDDSSPPRGQLSIRMQKAGSTFSLVLLSLSFFFFLWLTHNCNLSSPGLNVLLEHYFVIYYQVIYGDSCGKRLNHCLRLSKRHSLMKI